MYKRVLREVRIKAWVWEWREPVWVNVGVERFP